jgi:regulator of protease activity HflC (stomatin/prohibitin superfamily)
MNKKGQGGFVAVFVIILAVIGVIIAAAGYDTVDASHVGVKVRLGELKGTMQPGLQWTGLFTDVHQYDLRLRKMQVNMLGSEGAVDKDGQSVYANIEIIYRLNPENVQDTYANVGKDGSVAEILNVEGLVKEGFKSVTSKYESLSIFQERAQVKSDAIEQIKANFPSDYLILDTVVISNIDFNANFKAAIEQKKVAEETAKAKEQEVAVTKFEADKKIETARGAAESEKLAAEAQAYKTLTQAEAEAKALELKAQELTPLMIQNNWIDAWNGALPVYTMSGDMDMLMQMPSK